eukprot:356457-Chlamydomonas_euryale.AAC.6
MAYKGRVERRPATAGSPDSHTVSRPPTAGSPDSCTVSRPSSPRTAGRPSSPRSQVPKPTQPRPSGTPGGAQPRLERSGLRHTSSAAGATHLECSGVHHKGASSQSLAQKKERIRSRETRRREALNFTPPQTHIHTRSRTAEALVQLLRWLLRRNWLLLWRLLLPRSRSARQHGLPLLDCGIPRHVDRHASPPPRQQPHGVLRCDAQHCVREHRRRGARRRRVPSWADWHREHVAGTEPATRRGLLRPCAGSGGIGTRCDAGVCAAHRRTTRRSSAAAAAVAAAAAAARLAGSSLTATATAITVVRPPGRAPTAAARPAGRARAAAVAHAVAASSPPDRDIHEPANRRDHRRRAVAQRGKRDDAARLVPGRHQQVVAASQHQTRERLVMRRHAGSRAWVRHLQARQRFLQPRRAAPEHGELQPHTRPGR